MSEEVYIFPGEKVLFRSGGKPKEDGAGSENNTDAVHLKHATFSFDKTFGLIMFSDDL